CQGTAGGLVVLIQPPAGIYEWRMSAGITRQTVVPGQGARRDRHVLSHQTHAGVDPVADRPSRCVRPENATTVLEPALLEYAVAPDRSDGAEFHRRRYTRLAGETGHLHVEVERVVQVDDRGARLVGDGEVRDHRQAQLEHSARRIRR